MEAERERVHVFSGRYVRREPADTCGYVVVGDGGVVLELSLHCYPRCCCCCCYFIHQLLCCCIHQAGRNKEGRSSVELTRVVSLEPLVLTDYCRPIIGLKKCKHHI